MKKEISQKEIDDLYEKIKKDAQSYGYHLNPDAQFCKDLVRGLIINEDRYGYQSCPCRLSVGDIEKDRDIICPCDYRDTDLNDYGACYCGLYVVEDIVNGKKSLTSIPERRYMGNSKEKTGTSKDYMGNSILINALAESIKIPVWRCKVCGYLCAREQPPEVCPICKVKKDRFERFL
ncbi:MAG: ferredoxin:glutaredoxin reductase [Candidatus Atribacteria bacterium]|nr:ferredoxin:glutaredoxin reductase [Candidatus Atribacteria bacterium]